MRNTLVFAGSSCPALTGQICSNLGMSPAPVELTQFANGETSVKILTSIREKDVFVVQSGSSKINDSIMELLILISACKGGSANKITAVLPYFPYSRQSKKKSHRGAITARMLANLLNVAGVNHVITIDLHASQMQGFFRCPVDNLHAEPLIARWIRRNVLNWQEAVCVSKNAGGTKRVTSLADALKLNFGMVTTDKRRGGGNMTASMIMNRLDGFIPEQDLDADVSKLQISTEDHAIRRRTSKSDATRIQTGFQDKTEQPIQQNGTSPPRPSHTRQDSSQSSPRKSQMPSPLRSAHGGPAPARSPLVRAQTPSRSSPIEEEQEFTDERARDITQGRLVQGHIVPDDYPSPTQSAMSSSMILERPEEDPMEMSRNSSFFNPESHPLGGSLDAAASSDEEEEGFNNPGLEQMITLVGDVRNRTVFIVDDMIDKAGSWIAAAECVVKRGGAKRVYCVATHGLFGGDALEELEKCDCINMIIVTNSFPIPPEKARETKKLVVLDLSNLLAEAIRRNHYGESISPLFTHTYD
ncbi:phosphoribosyl pyrophosphokinase [Mollisia scopiformis]|uniref:Ribose-phosphate pyrophosphokinase 1 n=1 Tax=Mollisia scopiformis TaxID=149040 RepID=A0A194X1U9_MOLSC|nr:phosphoribosyl pyrophosphokinase [Mollisia scopiformis]KUJ14178.1 phosphoribosyl pyrophosphokinase [Mollisia scopiformis]